MRLQSPSIFEHVLRIKFWMGACNVYFRLFTFPLFADVQKDCNLGSSSVCYLWIDLRSVN